MAFKISLWALIDYSLIIFLLRDAYLSNGSVQMFKVKMKNPFLSIELERVHNLTLREFIKFSV